MIQLIFILVMVLQTIMSHLLNNLYRKDSVDKAAVVFLAIVQFMFLVVPILILLTNITK